MPSAAGIMCGHRASAGVPDAFAARVRDRVRLPLFAAMVAFAQPLGLPLDAVSVGGSSGLWFAARTQSKPGLEHGGGDAECWTLISTPKFAVDEEAEASTGCHRAMHWRGTHSSHGVAKSMRSRL